VWGGFLDIFALRDRPVRDYESHVGSFIKIKDVRIEDEVRRGHDEGLLWPDPLIQLNPSFEAGESIDELVDEGVLHLDRPDTEVSDRDDPSIAGGSAEG
jgi:hypothetical protein